MCPLLTILCCRALRPSGSVGATVTSHASSYPQHGKRPVRGFTDPENCTKKHWSMGPAAAVFAGSAPFKTGLFGAVCQSFEAARVSQNNRGRKRELFTCRAQAGLRPPVRPNLLIPDCARMRIDSMLYPDCQVKMAIPH